MIRISVQGQPYSFPEGTTLKEAAKDFAPLFEYPILLAFMNNQLCELSKPLIDEAEVRFLTIQDPIGYQTYKRSALMMLIKAFYAVVGRSNIERFSVSFSFGDGLYIQARGKFTLSPKLLEQVEARMKSYVQKQFPFVKEQLTRREAMELFDSYGMPEKSRLFHYRLRSRVNLYSLGNFKDYFYGYMASDTSSIPLFKLDLYEGGFLLRLPRQTSPSVIEPFDPNARVNLFKTLKETEAWASRLDVDSVSALNDLITREEASQLILIQEALMEKKIGQIAEEIANSGRKIVLIAGPSSSGKTTFAHRLCIQLKALGFRPHPISVDNYFVDRIRSPRHPDGSYNFEALECLDMEKLNQDLLDLLAGKKALLPVYNFETGTREKKGMEMQLKEDDLLIIEGIHCLNDKLTYALDQNQRFKIYISALSQFHIDEHNYISATDIRLIRRMVRDNRVRGVNVSNTIAGWGSVRKGEEENIFPFQDSADIIFNSALVYELSVMKKFARPLLYQVTDDDPHYHEAKRLLRFLDFFLDIDNETVPQNSLVREFIGGSVFPT